MDIWTLDTVVRSLDGELRDAVLRGIVEECSARAHRALVHVRGQIVSGCLEARRRRGHPDPQLYILTDQVRYPIDGRTWVDGPSDASFLKALGCEFLYRSKDKWSWSPETPPTTASASLASLIDAPTLNGGTPATLAQA